VKSLITERVAITAAGGTTVSTAMDQDAVYHPILTFPFYEFSTQIGIVQVTGASILQILGGVYFLFMISKGIYDMAKGKKMEIRNG